MAIKDDWVYILTSYRGYLAPIRQFGPIVHPAKVKKSEATALMMAGCPVVIYDPETKQSYPMTFENSSKTVKDALHEIQKPIETTVLNGAPKGAGDLGISERNKPVEPKMKIDLAATIKKVEEAKVIEEKAPVTTSGQLSTDKDEPTPETVTVTTTDDIALKIDVKDLMENLRHGILTESDIKWSDYTKAERRQIRACLNEIAAANAENVENA